MTKAQTPQTHASAKSLSSADSIAMESLKISRLSFCVGALAAGFAGAQTLLMMPELVEKFNEHRHRHALTLARQEELAELMKLYLYPSNPGSDLQARVALVPALQDPWGPPKRSFSGSGNSVAAAYVSRFSSPADEHIVQQVLNMEADDAPVLISSHLVSEAAASYFGDPKSSHPIHHIHYRDGSGGFKAHLRWTIYTAESAKVVRRRELFQGEHVIRQEPVHRLADLANSKLPQPQFVHQGQNDYQQEDYLLITALPRDSRLDRRMISLAGLHKPGTLAAAELLNSPDLALKILRQIHEKAAGLPYYQALLSTKVDYSSGLPRPTGLELVDVQAIEGVDRL